MVPPTASSWARHLVLATTLALGLAVAPAASAQGSTDGERAEALFDEARALMREGKYTEACAKLAESQALDAGGGTLLNLGICRRREGRTATAFSVLTEALAQARTDGRADRVATAERHLAELSPTLSRLSVRLGDGMDPALIVVEVDGERLLPDALGQAVALDPGVHEVRASRDHYASWSVRVTLAPVRDEQTVEVPVLTLETLPPPEPLPLAPPMVAPAARREPPRAPPQTARSEQRPSLGLGAALIGVGVGALGAGSYFGLRALTLRARSDRHFDGTHCREQSCVDDWNDAKSAALASNIGFAVGLVASGFGVYLVVRPAQKAGPPAITVSLEVNPVAPGATARASF